MDAALVHEVRHEAARTHRAAAAGTVSRHGKEGRCAAGRRRDVILWLWKYPMHKLGGFFHAVGWCLWSWGLVLHLGGRSGLMIAWLHREENTDAD